MKENQRCTFVFHFNTSRSNGVLRKSLISSLCSSINIIPLKIIICNCLNEYRSKTKDHSSIASHSSIFLTCGVNLMECSVPFPSLLSMHINEAWKKNRNRNCIKLHLSRPLCSVQCYNGDNWFCHWVLFSILFLGT